VCVTTREPRRTNRSWAGVFKVWVGLSRRPLLVRISGARFNVVASDVYFWAARRKRRYQLPEKDVISPDEVLSALKRYIEESGDTEQAVASRIGSKVTGIPSAWNAATACAWVSSLAVRHF
jgi:hypothetical protein